MHRNKKILFDGDQAELFSKNYSIKCSCCDQCSYISPLECNAASNLPSEVLTNVLSSIKGLKTVDLEGSKFYKVDNLPLKYIYFECKKCHSKYLSFFGLGEYQPARFIFKLLLIISIEYFFRKD